MLWPRVESESRLVRSAVHSNPVAVIFFPGKFTSVCGKNSLDGKLHRKIPTHAPKKNIGLFTSICQSTASHKVYLTENSRELKTGYQYCTLYSVQCIVLHLLQEVNETTGNLHHLLQEAHGFLVPEKLTFLTALFYLSYLPVYCVTVNHHNLMGQYL